MAEPSPNVSISQAGNPFASLLSADTLSQVRDIGAVFGQPERSPEMNKLLADAADTLREINNALSDPRIPESAKGDLQLSAQQIGAARSTGNLSALRTLQLDLVQRQVDAIRAEAATMQMQEEFEAERYASTSYERSVAYREQEYARSQTWAEEYSDYLSPEAREYPEFRRYAAAQVQQLQMLDPAFKADFDYVMSRPAEERAQVRKEMQDVRELARQQAERHPELREHYKNILHNNGNTLTTAEIDFIRKVEEKGYDHATMAAEAERLDTASYERRTATFERTERLMSADERRQAGLSENPTQAERDALMDHKVDVEGIRNAVDRLAVEQRELIKRGVTDPAQIKRELGVWKDKNLSEHERREVAIYDQQNRVHLSTDMRNTVAFIQSRNLTVEQKQAIAEMPTKDLIPYLQNNKVIGPTDADRRRAEMQLDQLDKIGANGKTGRQELFGIMADKSLTEEQRDKQISGLYSRSFAGTNFTSQSLYYATAKGDLSIEGYNRYAENISTALEKADQNRATIDKEAEIRASGKTEQEAKGAPLEERRNSASTVFRVQADSLREEAAKLPAGPDRQKLEDLASRYDSRSAEAKKNESANVQVDKLSEHSWQTMSAEQKAAFGNDPAAFKKEMIEMSAKSEAELGTDAGKDPAGAKKLDAYRSVLKEREKLFDKSAQDAEKEIIQDKKVEVAAAQVKESASGKVSGGTDVDSDHKKPTDAKSTDTEKDKKVALR